MEGRAKTPYLSFFYIHEKTNFKPIYNRKGKPSFSERQKPGVYIIKEDGFIIYVGYSKINFYKTLYRHFEKWEGPAAGLTFVDQMDKFSYTARIIYCTSRQAEVLEKMLIRRYKPGANKNKYKDFEPTGRDKIVWKSYQDAELI